MTLRWVNGQPADGLSVRDRGLAFGDGLFETIKVINGRPELLDRHLHRIEQGCRRLAIPCSIEALRQQLLAFSAQLAEGVAKLIVTRGEGVRGYAQPDPIAPSAIILGSHLPDYPQAHADKGVRLYPCTTRLAEQPLLAGLKHLNRLEQVLARAEWQDPAFAEGLMRDTSGRVVEGVFSNLFIVEAGKLVTPSLDRCGVAGVMRAELLHRADMSGVATLIADIPLERLVQADEVLVCNSLYGVWPVRQFEATVWSVGPLTRKLQRLIADLSSTT